MDPLSEYCLQATRRQFFGSGALRLGTAALAAMTTDSLHAADPVKQIHPPLPGLPHFPAKAKAVIYLHMNGGPSQLDLWDYKPALKQHFNADLPDSIRKGQRITTMTSGQAPSPRPCSNSPAMATAVRTSANCFHIPLAAWMTSRWSAASSPMPSIMTPPAPSSRLAAKSPANPASAPGSPMVLAVKATTFPPSSC